MANKIITGSLTAVAHQQNVSLAETFLNVETIILIDMSGSMSSPDAPGGRSRFEAAENELKKLQTNLPGKIAVIAFSGFPLFCPSGIPERLSGSTDMAAALQFVKAADDLGITFILISDGEPNSERDTLRIARTFKSKIHTIYIGPEHDIGRRKFLDTLARATGGRHIISDAPGLVLKSMEQLLLLG